MRTKIAGVWCMGVAVIHSLFGVVFGRKALGAIFQNGLFNAVDPHQDRQMVFWFLLASPLLFLIGQMIYSSTTEQNIPAYVGWEIFALILFAGVLMPVSGIWLLLVPAFLLVKRQKRATSSQKPPFSFLMKEP